MTADTWKTLKINSRQFFKQNKQVIKWTWRVILLLISSSGHVLWVNVWSSYWPIVTEIAGVGVRPVLDSLLDHSSLSFLDLYKSGSPWVSARKGHTCTTRDKESHVSRWGALGNSLCQLCRHSLTCIHHMAEGLDSIFHCKKFCILHKFDEGFLQPQLSSYRP